MANEPTAGEALAAFRAVNGLSDRDAVEAWWSCRLGPFVIRLPNFEWRKRALLAHDLHHVLTGIPCGLRGEFQMAAWEFGAGPMPRWGAALFCLPLALIGLLVTPRRVLRAYAAGRRSRTLHNSDMIDDVLAMPLRAARARLRRD
jgi:hypothetical protein